MHTFESINQAALTTDLASNEAPLLIKIRMKARFSAKVAMCSGVMPFCITQIQKKCSPRRKCLCAMISRVVLL